MNQADNPRSQGRHAGPAPAAGTWGQDPLGPRNPGPASLELLIRRDGPLPPARTALVGLAVLDRLTAVHHHGTPHGDVRPGSVLVGPDDQVTLAAPSLRDPVFTAPEGVTGPAADLWSLGATLFTAVEGRPPAPGASLYKAGPLGPVLIRLLAGDPALRPGPAELRGLLAEAARLSAPQLPALPPAPAPWPVPGSASPTSGPVPPVPGAVPPVPGSDLPGPVPPAPGSDLPDPGSVPPEGRDHRDGRDMTVPFRSQGSLPDAPVPASLPTGTPAEGPAGGPGRGFTGGPDGGPGGGAAAPVAGALAAPGPVPHPSAPPPPPAAQAGPPPAVDDARVRPGQEPAVDPAVNPTADPAADLTMDPAADLTMDPAMDPVVRSAGRPARRGSGQGVLVPRSIVVLTAVILVSMAAAIGVLLVPVLDGGEEGAAAPSGTRGRFATAPRACSLLTDEQAAQAVPAFNSSEVETAECNWLTSDWRSPSSEKFDLVVRLVAQEQDGSEVQRAKEYLAGKKKDAADKAATDGALPPQDLKGVGEEAFIAGGHQKIDVYGESYRVTIVLRVSNLVAEVQYKRGGVAQDTDGRVARNATQAARWVADALQAQG
ncbi:hypothetical protein ACFOWE_07710 [Planomonospora corallina]|uniref:Protein kinase domain-containing protein n=1 Tax=Planomonospora corallina TaxID=1806052 RepID=A0ABV8I1Y0_9ACTN